jgi:hypothetical protein
MTYQATSQEKSRPNNRNPQLISHFLAKSLSFSLKKKRKSSLQINPSLLVIPNKQIIDDPTLIHIWLEPKKMKNGRALFNELIKSSFNFKRIYANQDYFARKIGCCSDTISNWMRIFQQKGILDYGQQFHKRVRGKKVFGSNITNVSYYFKLPETRRKLSVYFSAFCFFSVAVLVSRCSVQLEERYLKKRILEDKTSKRSSGVTRYLDKMKNLTLESREKLERFPDEAIIYAHKLYTEADKLKINDPLTFFYKLCEQFCNTHDIKFKVPESKIKILKTEAPLPKIAVAPAPAKKTFEGITCHQMTLQQRTIARQQGQKKYSILTEEEKKAQNEFLSILGLNEKGS